MTHDEQVERVAEAIAAEAGIVSVGWGEDDEWIHYTGDGESWDDRDYYRGLAGSAIAALCDEPPLEGWRVSGDWVPVDEPPLEDMLIRHGGSTVIAHILPPMNGHDTRVATEVTYRDGRRKALHGTGPTIDAAIRAAVENAKGQGDE